MKGSLSRCSGCGEFLSPERFYLSDKWTCKKCRNKQKSANHHARKAEINARRRAEYALAYSGKEYREKVRKQNAAWRENNRGKERERVRAWKLCNKEKVQEQKKRNGKQNAHTRRARLKGCGGKFTTAEWNALCAKYDYKCLCCGERKILTVDHVIPLAGGGNNTIDNIQPLCMKCNNKKGVQSIDFR